MSKKKKNLNYPPDGGLPRQKRPWNDPSVTNAFHVLEKTFFPERYDENGNKKVVKTK